MKYVLLGLVITSKLLAFSPKDIHGLVNTEDLQEIRNIVASTLTSCSDKIISNGGDLALAQEELEEIARGVVETLSEAAITLALKKDFPSACHVMPQSFFEEIEESGEHGKECTWYLPWGTCGAWRKTYTPTFSYYWPKYFIEVAEKGNDPHPSFARNNLLYSASRKFAYQLSSALDFDGPYSLVAKVTAGGKAVKEITSSIFGQGFDLSPSPGEIDRLVETSALTPFEKMRIRASQQSEMPSYDVNIWPVGLSHSMAKHLSVCGRGGYEWKIPFVPMTCPVAMSRDAWSYWDSGFLDYLNPHAIRGITAASNPAACIGENLASTAFDELGPLSQRDSLVSEENKGKKDALLSNLPNSFRGIGMCSFPILGSAEAIAGQSVNLADSFRGPWCSLWGPVVPRQSTHVYANDFAFANSALKFKLLAHDLFGLPRGERERWALAYPWEGENASASTFSKLLKKLLVDLGLTEAGDAAVEQASAEDQQSGFGQLFDKLGIDQEKIAKFLQLPNAGRSSTLMPPGDPRMLDSFNLADMVAGAKNLAREAIYLAALNKASSEAENSTLRALQHTHDIPPSSPAEALSVHKNAINRVVDHTAREKEEPIFVERHYCYVWGEKRGRYESGNLDYEIPGFGTGYFHPVGSPDACNNRRHGSCLKRHPISRRCLRPESIFYISLTRQEISGYRHVQHPRHYQVISPSSCAYHDDRSRDTHHHHYRCQETLKEVGRDDTRDTIEHPNPHAPENIVAQASSNVAAQATAKAARTATWVGSELARARFEEMLGASMLPGKKRVYTIYEKISCRPQQINGGTLQRKHIAGIWYWSECRSAVRYEMRKYFQRKLLRRLCDRVLQQPLGAPFQ